MVPRDLSFFLTDSFAVFLLLRHVLGNAIVAFGRLLTCFSCSFFLILFRHYFCRITYPVQFYCCFRKIACSFLVLFLSDSFSVVILSHTYFVQLILLLLVAFSGRTSLFFSFLVWFGAFTVFCEWSLGKTIPAPAGN